MNVKNRKCIRKLSLKSLYANRRRNLIAIFAIALTTLLFTSMFTIVLSLNASYETYQFRQVGGYAMPLSQLFEVLFDSSVVVKYPIF